jgi:helix-turn-helix protein
VSDGVGSLRTRPRSYTSAVTTGLEDRVKQVSRRLRDLCEPIAGSVYFVPEAQDAYRALGLDNYGESYFTSRGACLGNPSGQVICAAFGVFNPDIVLPAVAGGWSKTDPASILDARQRGATAGLERLLGDADVSRIVDVLRPAMESVDYAGRALFAGLLSLPFPDHPLAQLWRVCDYVRERRGDGHIAAWVSAGCPTIEISLLTELAWGLQIGQYSPTRGWSSDQITAGAASLTDKGYLRDGALTDEGRAYRRSIEEATDRGEAVVVEALGPRADAVFALLEPLQLAVLEGKGYPVNPASTMSREGAL